MTSDPFSPEDRKQLEAHGLQLAEAGRQLELLSRPAHHVELVRPCTTGDGIESIGPAGLAGLAARHAEAAKAGRFTKFVPASGAATRMFAHLLYFLHGAGRDCSWSDVKGRAAGGDAQARELVTFVEKIDRFAFFEDLRDILRSRGDDLESLVAERAFRPMLQGLLGERGLNYDALSKGLLKFHRDPDGARTPFEEHLIEAAHYVKDGRGLCRLHLTVGPEHRDAFETLARRVTARYEQSFGVRFEIGYSVQKPSTDTLSLDSDGGPLRDEKGRLRFRPGGHGALIANLTDLQADLIFIKNIDNVQPERLRQATLTWKPTLAGRLVELQHEIVEHHQRLSAADPAAAEIERALEFARDRLHADTDRYGTGEERRERLVDRFDRPLRVCGVVPATGEPGGGPFWVRRPDGSIALQIVETAQVAPSPEQQAILAESTHFNPVDFVCAVRDPGGRPYDLERFVDPDAVIVTDKSRAGQDFRVIERPGLWNGGMAEWNTVFVEVPLETFSPVKTVIDLLREEHRSDHDG